MPSSETSTASCSRTAPRSRSRTMQRDRIMRPRWTFELLFSDGGSLATRERPPPRKVIGLEQPHHWIDEHERGHSVGMSRCERDRDRVAKGARDQSGPLGTDRVEHGEEVGRRLFYPGTEGATGVDGSQCVVSPSGAPASTVTVPVMVVPWILNQYFTMPASSKVCAKLSPPFSTLLSKAALIAGDCSWCMNSGTS